jgi:hypothetical protein
MNAADLPDVSSIAESIRAGDGLLPCMGLFSIFFVGSQNRVSGSLVCGWLFLLSGQVF